MIRFTTESGAEYVIRSRDDVREMTRLSGPFSPGIDYDVLPDTQWHELVRFVGVEVGKPATMILAAGKVRVTTNVVSVDYEED